MSEWLLCAPRRAFARHSSNLRVITEPWRPAWPACFNTRSGNERNRDFLARVFWGEREAGPDPPQRDLWITMLPAIGPGPKRHTGSPKAWRLSLLAAPRMCAVHHMGGRVIVEPL